MCALPRGHLGGGGKVYRVTSSWEGRSEPSTQEFVTFAGNIKREMCVKRAGLILGESDLRVWMILFGDLKEAHVRLRFDNLVCV